MKVESYQRFEEPSGRQNLEVILTKEERVTDFLRELKEKYYNKYSGSPFIINLPGGFQRDEFGLGQLQQGHSDRIFAVGNQSYFVVEGNDDVPQKSYLLRFINPDKISSIEVCLEDLKKQFDSLSESHPPTLDDSKPN